MAIVFALPRLFDAVVARFAHDGLDVEQTFGWLAPAEQMRAARRITWTPGDEGGSLGAVGAPRYIGGNPRQMATLLELCTVELYAFDDSAARDERTQYQAARELYDAWLRAVDLAAHGTYSIVSTKWVGGDRALRAGAALRVVLAVQAPIVDAPLTSAPADTGAVIGVRVLDVTESISVPPPG